MKGDEKLRNKLVIEGTRIGLWDWNIQTGETYFNSRWAEIIGYTLDELKPISINTWGKYAHPKDLIISNKLLEEHFNGKSDYYDFKSRMKHKDGHWVWVHDRGKVFEWDKNGKPLRMCGSHIDITNEKNTEIELKKTIYQKDILLREVHHRVKNNLQLLLSISRLKDHNGVISTSEIKNSILSIAKAYEAIYKTDNFENISIKEYLNKIISDIISLHNITLKIVGDNVKYDIDFLIPLGLIISELTNNSIKYAFINNDDKQIKISILKNKSNLEIIYSDNGFGYNEKIFNHKNHSNSFGIKIIKALCKQLNANVKFYNNNGATTEILIYH